MLFKGIETIEMDTDRIDTMGTIGIMGSCFSCVYRVQNDMKLNVIEGKSSRV